MIKTEYPYDNNDGLVKTYSDAGFMILQNETGQKYGEAVDVYPCRYTYTETDEPMEAETEEEALEESDDTDN